MSCSDNEMQWRLEAIKHGLRIHRCFNNEAKADREPIVSNRTLSPMESVRDSLCLRSLKDKPGNRDPICSKIPWPIKVIMILTYIELRTLNCLKKYACINTGHYSDMFVKLI